MSISTTALDRRSAVKIAAAASLLAAGGACIFMVDAAHAEDEGRAEGGRETVLRWPRGLSREAAQLSQLPSLR